VLSFYHLSVCVYEITVLFSVKRFLFDMKTFGLPRVHTVNTVAGQSLGTQGVSNFVPAPICYFRLQGIGANTMRDERGRVD